MPEPTTLALFVVAALALLVTPGPAVLYIVTRSIDQGRAAGIASAFGIQTGTLVHVIAAALGLSALLVSSSLAFSVVKYLGAAYLIYLGVRKLLSKTEAHEGTEIQAQPLRRIFYQGAVVNLLNPKTAIFIFAFLPQFVDPARGSVAVQILFLGTVLMLLGLLSDGTYAIIAGSASRWLRGNLRFLNGQRIFAGGVYIALGMVAAVSDTGRAK